MTQHGRQPTPTTPWVGIIDGRQVMGRQPHGSQHATGVDPDGRPVRAAAAGYRRGLCIYAEICMRFCGTPVRPSSFLTAVEPKMSKARDARAQRPGPCPCSVGGGVRVAASTPPAAVGPPPPRPASTCPPRSGSYVATHARVAAAAALAGVDRSTWINRAITDALKGIVVFDRTKADDHEDPLGQGIGGTEAA